MRVHDNGSTYTVQVSAAEVRDFAARWPCSGMRNPSRGMAFEFDKRNGDLVDIRGERKGYDEGAVRALSEDAQEFAAPHLLCSNCGGPLPTNHGCHGPTGLKFCDACAAIGEALAIGARQPVMLYESASKPGPIPGLNAATSWTGAVLGYIYGRTAPARYRRFAPVRYRVKMLDGSHWYGFGPSANGNYIRLRPMKGE